MILIPGTREGKEGIVKTFLLLHKSKSYLIAMPSLLQLRLADWATSEELLLLVFYAYNEPRTSETPLASFNLQYTKWKKRGSKTTTTKRKLFKAWAFV